MINPELLQRETSCTDDNSNTNNAPMLLTLDDPIDKTTSTIMQKV